ncbi:hypothetical protein EV361DRAFT_819278 [Lentinula raphanica]|nr:hypothetical protein EV361DRAFT_819278 [Lentinula raphanica]
MPTKGKRKKTSLLSSTWLSNLGELLSDVDDLKQIVNITHTRLKIPDLSTTAGLKRVYFKFDDIVSRLDAAFTRYEDDDKIVSGVVAIYTELCVDAILRARLFENPDILQRLLNLLNRDACRQIVLHMLTSAAHHSGTSLRADLARNASALVQTLKDHSDERPTVESIIDILSNSVSIVVDGDYHHGPRMPEILRSVDMKTILELTVHHMRQSYASKDLINHGLHLILASAMHCTSVFRSVPDLDMFLVAGLKSKNWGMRGACFSAIIRSYGTCQGTAAGIPSLGLRLFPPEFFEEWPPHLLQILEQYGLPRCHTIQTHLVTSAYMAVLDYWEANHDYYALGADLADLPLVTELILPHTSSFPAEETIPRCLQELRARGTSTDLERADILEIKLLLNVSQNWDRLTSKCREFLMRNPNSAFVFYVLSQLALDAESGLRAAKKGLKYTDKETTPSLYFMLLRRAVELAAILGLIYFHKEHTQAQGKMMWEEAIAFLMSALEDSRIFVDEAPPDHPCMTIILYWNIILEITFQGPNADLKVVEGALQKLKIYEEIGSYLELPVIPTNARQPAQLIVNLFERADKEWGRDIESMNARIDDQIPLPPNFSKIARDDLTAWLSDMRIETFSCSTTIPEPAIPLEDDHCFKRCAWCRNPSVVLKKCSGCESARYCDIQCQREHWSKHKQDCKGKGKAKS